MKMLMVILFTLLSSSAQAGRGAPSSPAIPCYIKGKMVSASMKIVDCKVIGGTHIAKNNRVTINSGSPQNTPPPPTPSLSAPSGS